MLSCSAISVRYANGAIGVHDISVEVKPGAITAMLGPNGAGKTTTVRALSGFLRAERATIVKGDVQLDGRSVANQEPQYMSRLGVAVVPEARKLFPALTVEENLRAVVPRPPKATRSAEYERIYQYFPVLRERATERAGQLSGGEQQMLAIARAVVKRPKYLLIDELSLGLHVSLQPMLADIVRTLAAQGTGVLIIDENTSFAVGLADQCYIIRSGTVADSGPSARFEDESVLSLAYVGS